MTQDEIIELAKQAGMEQDLDMWFSPSYEQCDVHILELERFAKLVAEKIRKETLEEMIYAHPTTAIKQAVEYEREACAQVCIDLAADYINDGHPASQIAAKASVIGATRIRARGQA